MTGSTAVRKLRKALQEPGVAWRVAWSLFRGRWTVLVHRLRGVRLEAGRDLRIYGRLVVRGPGRVVLGHHVRIGMTVTPWTYHPDALIEIGDETYMNGTRFGCQKLIRVGPRGILAEAQVMDTDFHSTSANRHDPGVSARVAPVILDANVWVCTQAGLLPGTRIGRNSVVGFGAICSGDYPEDVVIAGNPAKVVRPIDGTRPTAPA